MRDTARATEVTGGVAMMTVAATDRRLWASKLRQHCSGWSLLASQAGFCITSFGSGVKVQQVLAALAVTDLAGEAVVGVGEETTSMTHHHRTTTKDGQARAHMAQTSLRARDGDLEAGPLRSVELRLGMRLDAWQTEATRPTAAGAVMVVGTMEKVARGHPQGLAPASRTQGMRVPDLARPQGGRRLLQDAVFLLAQNDTHSII